LLIICNIPWLHKSIACLYNRGRKNGENC